MSPTRIDLKHEPADRYAARIREWIARTRDCGWTVIVPNEWMRQPWIIFDPGRYRLPAQGWKIHVSLAAAEADRLFDSLLPFLLQEAVAFKVPKDLGSMVQCNAGLAGASQAGKVLTVYPADSLHAERLAVELDRTFPTSRGPVVVGDGYLRAGGAVSMRYGSIAGGELIVDALGGMHPALRTPQGELVPDRRGENFAPSWADSISVPLIRAPELDLASEFSVAGRRYLPLDVLRQGPKTTVLLVLEIEACRTAVLKVARAGIAGDPNGEEERDRLNNEYNALCQLRELGIGPTPVSFLWSDPARLILEDLDGAPIADSLGWAWCVLNSTAEDARQARWTVFIFAELTRQAARLHAANWVHHDLTPSNVMVCQDGRVRIIDFGLARTVGAALPTGGTSNYLNPADRWTGAISDPRQDVFSLGSILASMALGWDACYIPEPVQRMTGLLQLAGAHECARLVRRCWRSLPERFSSEQLCTAVEAATTRIESELSNLWLEPPACKDLRRWALRASWESGSATRFFREWEETGVCRWRNAHLQPDHCLEGINLGAAGILLGLCAISALHGRDDFEDDISGTAEWLSRRPPCATSHGLFTGNAGVALALTVASVRTGNKAWIEKARMRLSTAAHQSSGCDLFAGAAGVVWAGTLMHELLDRAAWPLEEVSPAVRSLLQKAQCIQDVLVWPAMEGMAEAWYLGAAHGSAGIALALAAWGRAASKREVEDLAREVFQSLQEPAAVHDHLQTPKIALDGGEASPPVNWCHGAAGILWCLLLAFGDANTLRRLTDWLVETTAHRAWCSPGNPTRCHGLAGQLELWSMISAIERHATLAERRSRQWAAVLRLLAVRRQGLRVWGAEEPEILTPDLWVGFLGPATALAMWAKAYPFPLLSAPGLKLAATVTSSNLHSRAMAATLGPAVCAGPVEPTGAGPAVLTSLEGERVQPSTKPRRGLVTSAT